MGRRDTAIANLERGRNAPNNGKHGKWLKTIEANNARELYLQKLAAHMDEIVDVQIEAAKDIENGEKDRREVIHQFVGKPIEKIEVRSLTLKVDL